jgi:hypothetical protein
MPPAQESAGAISEKYIKDFADATYLRVTAPYSLEQVVRLLNEKLHHLFIISRPYLDEYFPYGNEWIDAILKNRSLNDIDPKVKSKLVEKLLDNVLSTDLLISINDNNGKSQLIAIDVTCDPTKKESKLNAIQGRREDGDTFRFNANRNISEVRKNLGINKHFVLLVDNKNLPSRALLLEELFAAANARARTGIINLRTPREVSIEPVAEVEPIVPAPPSPIVLTMVQASEIALAAREWLRQHGELTATNGLYRENSGWSLEWEQDALIIEHEGKAVLIDANYLNEESVPAQDIPILEQLRDYIFEQSQQVKRDNQLEP